MLGSPVLYEQIEERLTALLGCEDSLLLPTITHIHASVLPVLAGSGTIFLDAGPTRRCTTAARWRAATARRSGGSDSKTPGTSSS